MNKKYLGYLYITLSLIGIVVAFSLTYDKIQVLKNLHYVPSCNINPILSCGDIMNTKQADLLGVPNPIFGLIGFSILLAFGLCLSSGARFARWLWLLINVGVMVSFSFSVYLFFQAVFRIHAICPLCFIIWMITPPLFWYTTLYNLRENYFKIKNQSKKTWILKHHGDILISWYLIVFLTLIIKFWYYWKTII